MPFLIHFIVTGIPMLVFAIIWLQRTSGSAPITFRVFRAPSFWGFLLFFFLFMIPLLLFL
ncbi:hypothetical protein [Anaerotruncus rubiinfantis]|jgi:hypothetical protein|uniref:hypothetical protein n=1 Tax=Anaerotruncus rubiinfantis TaxID=1720200 RepID=UPI0034A29A9A